LFSIFKYQLQQLLPLFTVVFDKITIHANNLACLYFTAVVGNTPHIRLISLDRVILKMPISQLYTRLESIQPAYSLML